MLGVDDTKKELEQMSAEDVADKNASSILFYDTPAELLYLNRVFMNPHLFDQLKQPIALTFGDVTLLTSVHDWVPRMTLYRPAGLQSKLISVSHNQHAHIAELSSVVFMLKFADEHTKPSFCEKKAGAFLLGHVLSPLQELNPSVLSVMQKPKPNMPVSTVQKCTVLIHTTGRVGPNTRFLFQELVEL